MKEKENKCIFCEIIKGNIPAKIIAENEHAVAFLDAFPITDGHTLVIPKKHCTDLVTCDSESLNAMTQLVQQVARTIESCKKLDPWGFNYLSNQGKIAGQEVFHFHIHIIPKYDKQYGLNPSATKNPALEPIDDVYDWIKKKSKSRFVKPKK